MKQVEIVDHPIQKCQETTWLLMALLTPLFVNLWVEQQFEASKVWLMRTLVWVLATLWLGGWINGTPRKLLPIPIGKLVTAVGLILLLSTLLSTNHYIAIFGTLDRANGVLTQMSYLLLFLCVATQINTQRSQRLLHVIILTSVPICLLGLAQAVGWQLLPVFTDARSPLTTTLGRANFTGAYLALLLPLTLGAVKTAMGSWQRNGYSMLVVLELVIIALTQARAAWIAAIAGVSVLFWLWVTPRWSQRARWSSALGGFIVLSGGLLLVLHWGIAAGGSIAARWTIWQASLRLVWPHLWLGYGADTLELHFPSVYPPQLVYYQGRGIVVDRAHNWLLDWSLNYGVLATIILIALIYLVLRRGWQRLSSHHNVSVSPTDEQRAENDWIAACMASMCAQLVGNLFLFDIAATALLFWLLSAIVIAATIKYETQTPQLSMPLWGRNAVMIVSTLILAWAVWWGNARPLLADAHIWRGTRALSQSNPASALIQYSAAVRQQPQRAAYQVAVALTATELGNFIQADTSMREAISLRPTDPVLYTQLAKIYSHQAPSSSEVIALAYASYEQAIVLAPTIALTYRQYADLALRMGDVDIALTQAQKSVELDATDGVSYGILGWAHLQAGNLVASQEAFSQAVTWTPGSADFHLGLATAYFQQGKFAAAKKAMRHSLARDPNYVPTLTLQRQLQDKE